MDRDGVLQLIVAIPVVVLLFWLADEIRGCDHGRFEPPTGGPLRGMDIGR